MMKTHFPVEYAKGLSIYAWQAASSLDRAVSSDFQTKLADYYSELNIPAPKDVITSIGQKRISNKNNIELILLRIFKSLIYFSNEELSRIESALANLDFLLSGEKIFSHEDRIRLRLELSYISVSINSKLPRSMLRRIKQVEHFNQNTILETNSLEQLIGKWPIENQ